MDSINNSSADNISTGNISADNISTGNISDQNRRERSRHRIEYFESDIHDIINNFREVHNENFDCDFSMENGDLMIEISNGGNVDTRFQLIQNIMSYMFQRQVLENIHHGAPGPMGNFTVLHTLGEQRSLQAEYHYHFSVDHEEKPDYFANCHLINKFVGKAEKIKKDDPLLLNEEDCFICLEKYKEKELKRVIPKCSHVFHKKCIDKWLKNKSNCPHCRCDLMENVELKNEDIKEYL